METLIISIISVGCAIVGALVGIFTYKRNQHKDDEVHEKDLKEETQETYTIRTYKQQAKSIKEIMQEYETNDKRRIQALREG